MSIEILSSAKVANRKHPTALLLGLVACASCPSLAMADIVELRDGGVICGKVRNPSQGAMVTIETEDGSVIEVDRKQVKIRQSLQRDLDYAESIVSRGESLEDQREIVTECMNQQMVTLANAHRERIVELDPNDRNAWENLKYMKDEATGKWIRKEVANFRRGKIKGDKGLWFTWQEKALMDLDEKRKIQTRDAERELDAKLKGLSGNSRQQAESEAYFQTLNNPMLIRKLHQLFREDPSPNRMTYFGLLQQMPPYLVTPTIIQIAMEDADINVVNNCLDYLAAGDDYVREMAVNGFASFLPDKKRRDRAAYNMGPFNDKRFIGIMINSLLSTDTVVPAGPPGNTNAGFSSNGGVSFANGAPPPSTRINQHKDVLAALQSLTGESFGYDMLAWRQWFAQKYAYENMDSRRDEY